MEPFGAEQGTSLETPSRARASSRQEVGTTWFSRVAAAFSSYDGDLMQHMVECIREVNEVIQVSVAPAPA